MCRGISQNGRFANDWLREGVSNQSIFGEDINKNLARWPGKAKNEGRQRGEPTFFNPCQKMVEILSLMTQDF